MKIITELPKAPPEPGQFVAIDLEMFGQDVDKLHRPHGEFACLSIAYGGKVYQYYDLTAAQAALDFVRPGYWVFHNALYDITQLNALVRIEEALLWDTMLVDRLLWGGYYSTFSLADLVRRYLGKKMEKDVRATFGESSGMMTQSQKDYAALDALLTLEVAEHQRKIIDVGSLYVYENIDAPMVWVVLDMKPVRVDEDGWTALAAEFKEKGYALQDELGFNVYSVPQLKAAFKERHRLTLRNAQKKTLEALVEEGGPAGRLAQATIDAKAYRKADSTYGAKWLEKNVESGFVHAAWRITGTETGRMACASPNLQQIPSRNIRLGMDRYRNMFISNDGMMVVSDVAQQEPRITAHITKDEGLNEAVQGGEDVHAYVAKKITGKSRVTKEERDLGKSINLGLSYGLTPHGLAARTNLSEDEADQLLQEYFERFPGVRDWMASIRNQARRDEYVSTKAGRKIYLNMYNDQWVNNAVNAPIQGGAADHTKLTLINLRKACQEEGLEFPVCMVIHDEIVIDAPTGTVKTFKRMVQEAWLSAAETLYPGTPFAVDIHTGKDWGCK